MDYHRNKNNADAGNMRAVMEATEPAIEDGKVISDYIKSLKLRNRTDQLDAAAIAKYGAERRPTPHLELSEEYKCLRELTRQRNAIKAQLVATKARLGEVCNFSKIIKIQKDLIKSFEKTIKSLEKEITKCINESADLREDVKFACFTAVGFRQIGLLPPSPVQ